MDEELSESKATPKDNVSSYLEIDLAELDNLIQQQSSSKKHKNVIKKSNKEDGFVNITKEAKQAEADTWAALNDLKEKWDDKDYNEDNFRASDLGKSGKKSDDSKMDIENDQKMVNKGKI